MLRKTLGITSAFFGAAYLFGVLINSLYLSNNNIHDLTLFKADYILMGSMFLLYLMIPSLVITSIITLGIHFVKGNSLLPAIKAFFNDSKLSFLLKIAVFLVVVVVILSFTWSFLCSATIPALFFSTEKIMRGGKNYF